MNKKMKTISLYKSHYKKIFKFIITTIKNQNYYNQITMSLYRLVKFVNNNKIYIKRSYTNNKRFN